MEGETECCLSSSYNTGMVGNQFMSPDNQVTGTDVATRLKELRESVIAVHDRIESRDKGHLEEQKEFWKAVGQQEMLAMQVAGLQEGYKDLKKKSNPSRKSYGAQSVGSLSQWHFWSFILGMFGK